MHVNAEMFLPDGFQKECSSLYHWYVLTTMRGAIMLAKFLNAPVPKEFFRQYEAGVETLQYIAYPDRTLAMLSDANPQWRSIVSIMETGAAVFDREDFRWLATAGGEGKPPAHCSHDFAHAGYCVMRDRWGPDGQVLIFDAGYFGAGHQHEDKLNFVYYAGDRELIGDAGIFTYKADEFEPYWRGTWSHNTIVIDELSQDRRMGPPEAVPDPARRFIMGQGFDFAVGWYRHAYSSRKAALWGGRASRLEEDQAMAIRDLQHQRCIFYVKGKYAIICDRVLGKGQHQIDILFHPTPILMSEGEEPEARAVKLEIRPDGAVVTKELHHANVAILPAQGNSLETLDLIGQKNPPRGWYALYGRVPSHDIVYRCSAELPQHFETVVQPLPAGGAGPMQVESRQVDSENGKMYAALSYGNDLFLISYDGPADMACDDVRFHGTALLLSYDQRGSPVRAYMVDRKLLTIGDRQVFSTDTPTPSLSLDLR